MRHDVHLAIRALSRNKRFFAAAATILGLGIGATTAMFSVTYGVLFRPLPYPQPERLVQLSEWHPGATNVSTTLAPSLSNLTYYAWVGQSHTISTIATYSLGTYTVDANGPVRMAGGTVSPSLFDVLHVSPALGRFFSADDVQPGAPPVVVLSDSLWRENFGSDPAIVNKTINIAQRSHTIVGVAPRGFAFPDDKTRFWAAAIPRSPVAAGNVQISPTRAIARLLLGVTTDQAALEGTAIARSQARPPMADMIWGKGGPVEVRVQRVIDRMTAPVRPVLLLFLAASACLLLISCVNVANLLLTRGAARERELAVMLAIGASRGRVIRQLFAEGAIVALAGGLAGIALASMIVRTLPAVAPVDFPRLEGVRLDWVTAAFAGFMSLFSGAMGGLMPAIRSGRTDPLLGLRTSNAASPRHTARTRQMMLVVEASLAMLLLVVSIIVGRSFMRLLSVNPGYDAAHVLTARVFLPGGALRPGEADDFASALLGRLRALPDVQAAGAGWMSPFGGSTSFNTLTIAVPGHAPVTARSLVNVVTPGYAEALRLELRGGRLLTDADLSSSTQSVVVNEEFVKTFLVGAEPVGQNLGVILSRGVEATVVGVVKNVLKDGLQSTPQPEVYVPPAHRYSVGGEIKLVIRAIGDPISLAGIVRQLARDLRRDVAIDNVLPLRLQLSDSVRTERLTTSTLGAFATLAMLLASAGLYGVVSYSVSTRQREIGIRSALGASARDVMWLVVRDGMRVAVIGLLIGTAAAVLAARVLESQLRGVQAADPVAFMVAALALAAVALTACVIPGRRAAEIEPAAALRYE